MALKNPIINANTGTYFIDVIDSYGCTNSDSFNLVIGVDDFSTITGQTTLCPGQTLNLNASGGVSYSWTGPNAYTSSTSNVTITNIQDPNEGVYQVLVTDTAGCSSIDSAIVNVAFNAGCLNIPQLVTPDADGHNDGWNIEGLDEFPEAEVSIFNRWGNLIYQVKPYTSPWTGEPNEGITIDGKSGKVPFGTYYYLIKLNDQEKTEYKGFLELQY
jgi:gliding motility-associated-like protein